MSSQARPFFIGALAFVVACAADPSTPSGPPGQQPSGSEPSPEASVDVALPPREASAADTSADAATLTPDVKSDRSAGPVTDGPRADALSPDAPSLGGWQLVWSDEF